MAHPPNALQIMDYVAPYPGNFIRSIAALEQALKRRDAECLLLFPQKGRELHWIRELQRQGSRVFFLSGNPLRDAGLIAWLVARHRIRIVHTHFAAFPIYAAARLARLLCPGTAAIAHLHNHEKARGTLRLRLKRALIGARLYVGVSQDVADDLVAKGYSARKCMHVPNAVDFARLDAFDGAAAAAWRQPGRKQVLLFGFDFERKGVDVAVEAMHRHGLGESMTLNIVLAKNREAVEARITRMLGGLPPWIRLLPPRDDIGTYYRMADVFLSSSREEGLPYSLVEAAYCGLRLVASDIPGQRNLGIPHTLYFAGGDCAALARALELAVRCDVRQSAACIEAARSHVVGRFRLESWVDEVMRISRSVSPRSGVESQPA
jgi:glycosyltransferase involved in cell wall biosynthesis